MGIGSWWRRIRGHELEDEQNRLNESPDERHFPAGDPQALDADRAAERFMGGSNLKQAEPFGEDLDR